MLLLVALVAGAPAPAEREPGGAPLAGCTARPGGDTWEYACDGLRADVIDDAGTLDAVFLDGKAAALRSAGGAAEVVRERGRVAGQDVELLRYSGGTTRYGVTVLLQRREGTRVVTCIGAPWDRCGPVVEALARGPWRAAEPAEGAVAVAAPEILLAGRRPAIPSGCTLRSGRGVGGQIVCPGGRIAGWSVVRDEETAARLIGELRRNLTATAPPGGKLERVACRIAGADAECDRFVAIVSGPPGRPEAHRWVAMWGWATVEGNPTVGLCTAAGDAPVPPPCASIFDLR